MGKLEATGSHGNADERADHTDAAQNQEQAAPARGDGGSHGEVHGGQERTDRKKRLGQRDEAPGLRFVLRGHDHQRGRVRLNHAAGASGKNECNRQEEKPGTRAGQKERHRVQPRRKHHEPQSRREAVDRQRHQDESEKSREVQRVQDPRAARCNGELGGDIQQRGAQAGHHAGEDQHPHSGEPGEFETFVHR